MQVKHPGWRRSWSISLADQTPWKFDLGLPPGLSWAEHRDQSRTLPSPQRWGIWEGSDLTLGLFLPASRAPGPGGAECDVLAGRQVRLAQTGDWGAGSAFFWAIHSWEGES